MIEVKNLVKKYGNHMAIDHLNFKIEKGQIYGFLGPNGAGKSTTMNIMTGYLGATEGEVLIDGHDILNVEHISNIHTQERADKTCSARIQTEGGCDIREALFFAFAKNECPLLELQTSRISLEEVFLELTQNDAVGEEERTNAGNL